MDFKETCEGQLSQFFDAFILSLFGLVTVCILVFVFFVFDVWICSPLPFVFLLSYFAVCCLVAFGCTFLWIGPCFFCFICFYLLVRLHFHLSRPFFLFEPCYIWLYLQLFVCTATFPSLTVSTWTLFSWFYLEIFVFFTCLCGYTFISHTSIFSL